MSSVVFVPIYMRSYYHNVDIKYIFINEVSIKDNILAIIPKI